MKKLTREEFIEKAMRLNPYVADGTVEIRGEYIDSHSRIECFCRAHNQIWEPKACNLYRGSGCRMCGIEAARKSRTLSQEEFVKRIDALGKGYKVIGPYIDSEHKVEMLCSRGHVFYQYPQHLFDGIGCQRCSRQDMVKTKNSLWDTRPDVAKFLKNAQDGYKYGPGSHIRTIFICPQCSHEVSKIIRDVCQDGLSCNFCSDGISYPNKFGRALLDQLPIENHICEYNPDWLRPYFYDNYFEYKNKKYVLEMDGGIGHGNKEYKSNTKDVNGVLRDQIKDSLAIQHDIYVIRIDCVYGRNDRSGYIKNSVINSELSSLIDLGNVDWELCDKKSQKTLVKEACNLYMSGIHNLRAIGELLRIHHKTVSRYLKKGVKFGWCDYTAEKGKQLTYISNRKPVVVLDVNGNMIHRFVGMQECADEIQILYNVSMLAAPISRACRSHKLYKGFYFMYASEYDANN